MSKMNELSQALDDLIACGEHLIAVSKAIKECFTSNEAPEQKTEKKTKTVKKEKEAPKPAAPAYTKEFVRDLLAAKASEAEGAYKVAVKELVKKYGNGGSLTDIPVDKYPDLVNEVEGLTNG